MAPADPNDDDEQDPRHLGRNWAALLVFGSLIVLALACLGALTLTLFQRTLT